LKKILKNLRKNWITYGFETLVVIVGILGAFALNNWNENRKTTNLEIEYLKRLYSDIANDTAYYQRRINYADKVFIDHKKTVQNSYLQIESSKAFSELCQRLEMSSEALSIRDITYKEMLNAGQINIVKSDRLKTEIMEFYRQVDVAAKHFDEINKTSIAYLIDFDLQSKSGKYMSRDRLFSPWTNEMFDEMKDWEWINDKESENFQLFHLFIGFYSTKQEIFKSYFIDLKAKSTILLVEIKNELSSRSIHLDPPIIEPVFTKE
jgi:hypothetical protein